MWLEDEQEELLAKFVEAHRNTPRESRGGFLGLQTHGNTLATFMHLQADGISIEGSFSDAEVLARAELLGISYGSGGSPIFSVMPAGIQHYQERKRANAQAVAVESAIVVYMHDPGFAERHRNASIKWEQAARLLWGTDSAQQLTMIGHLVREALQEFVISLGAQRGLTFVETDKAKTKNRLREVVTAAQVGMSDRVAQLLVGLSDYFDVISNLAQRQEHGDQSPGGPLRWEDARRVVFHVAVVMHEFDRTLRG